MRKSINNPLFAVVCLAVFGTQLLSCEMVTCETASTEEIDKYIVCSASLAPDTLRFNVIGKDTRVDLFLSENPAYDLDDLKLLFRMPVGENLLEVDPYLSDDGSYLYTLVSTGRETNSFFLRIGEQPLDTIVYTTKGARTQPGNCPYLILDQVTFNHEAPEKNAHGRIVPFYRKE